MLLGRHVLLIEDNDNLAMLYAGQLKHAQAEVQRCADGESGLQAVREGDFSAILLDIQLPDIDGFEVLKRLGEMGCTVPVIVITAHGSVNWAVEAMRRGAYDFLVKPFDTQRLLVTVSNAAERHDLAGIIDSVTQPLSEGFHDFVGGTPEMQAVYRTIAAAAASRASVFITGESGTGKELCARAIHAESPRRKNAFVALNCGAIPRDLMESEIFGHRKGAFTGAVADRTGAADLADGGTLFLDEIGEMDMDLQTKLLRFIQTGTFTRIGENAERHVDVRFVCATNREPAEAIRDGNLREDLYYRLNVIPIRMPALRDRVDDVQHIARSQLTRFAEEEGKRFRDFDEGALDLLAAHAWPGNVRELENVVRNATVLNDGDLVTGEMIAAALGNACRPAAPRPEPAGAMPSSEQPVKIRSLAEIERDAIESAVAQFDGNIPKAATALGVAPSTLYRKIQAWRGAPT